jgi:prepilin-type processing-associated H-X9-DG protein
MKALPQAGVMTNTQHGCWTYLLPYLEQQALANLYRWDVDFSHPVNQPVVSTPLKILQCPSAPPDRFMTAIENPGLWSYGGKGACLDYAVNLGVNPVLATQKLIDPVGNYEGTLPVDKTVRLADVTDGTSNTILIVESAGRPTRWQLGRAIPNMYIVGGAWGGAGGVMLAGTTPDGATRPGPCALNCNNDREIYSFHPGGANAMFTDGSVRFLKAGMDIRTVARLLTRAGGEVVSGED